MAIHHRTQKALFWCLAATIAVRIAFPRMFGLLDSDSIVLFLDARRQVDTGQWSMVATLPVHIISFFYRLLGEKLFAARWVSVLAGLGTMLVLFEAAGRSRAGRIAALIFGVIPAAVFFGTSALPYGLLSFLGLLGLWLLARADQPRRAGCAVLAGLAFGGAFLCKTFAAVLILPVALALVGGVVTAAGRRRRSWVAPLLAGLTWVLVVGGAVAWRWPAFGWSVFNDYPIDWRFELAAAVWSGRWVGLINLHALALPLLLPGLIEAWRVRRSNLFAALGLWYVAAVAAVYLLNPVNHFPRVLFPAVPILAYFVALAVDRALERRRTGLLLFWLGTAAGLLSVHWLMPGWWLDARLWPALAAAIFAVGLALALERTSWVAGARVTDWLGAALLVVVTLFGLRAGYGALDRVERAYMARADAVRFAATTSGIIGGSDVAHLVLDGKKNYSTLLDLPRERLQQVLTDGLAGVMRELGTPLAVVDTTDSEGMLAMLAPLAAEMGLPAERVEDPFASLETDERAARIFDNGWFVLYQLDDVPPPDSKSWPRWNRVQPPWDRTGMGLQHSTPSRLIVRQRPLADAPVGASERRVVVELTDVPGGENYYRLSITGRNRRGQPLWEWADAIQTDHDRESPGVQLVRLAVDRPGGGASDTLLVPTHIKGIRSFVFEAQPVGTGRPLRVLVPVPAWW